MIFSHFQINHLFQSFPYQLFDVFTSSKLLLVLHLFRKYGNDKLLLSLELKKAEKKKESNFQTP